MNYNIEDIDKITRFKTWGSDKKVNALLQIDSYMYTNLGLDSTDSERKKAKVVSRKIYRAIAQISPVNGYLLEAHMNEKDLTKIIK